MTQSLSIPAGDTRLNALDTPGAEPALVFLNGAFGTVHNWRPVVKQLAGRYRTVMFDARARGKSGTSADYSVQTATVDVGRVIDATGIAQPVLVGWSHGATLAVRYAAQNPGQVAGLVLIDGAFPISAFDEAGKQQAREQFRKLGWLMRILATFGRSARMTPYECADVVIGLDTANGELKADFAELTCPAVFVLGTGAHSGSTETQMRKLRDAVTIATSANRLVSVHATVSSNHAQILGKASGVVAQAIDGMARR